MFGVFVFVCIHVVWVFIVHMVSVLRIYGDAKNAKTQLAAPT